MYLVDTIYDAVKAHAEETFPEECCGLVLNDGTTVKVANTSPAPNTSFSFDPVELIRYRGSIDYVYHSHPNRSPAPSVADKKSCEELKIPFLIVSIPSGEASSCYPTNLGRERIGRTFVYGVSDCFTIVADYYNEELGITLPEIVRPPFGWWLDGNTHIIEGKYKELGFSEVTRLEKGDVILMQAGGGTAIDHMAVYIGDQHILHHTILGLSRISPYSGYWIMATKKFLRHEGVRG